MIDLRKLWRSGKARAIDWWRRPSITSITARMGKAFASTSSSILTIYHALLRASSISRNSARPSSTLLFAVNSVSQDPKDEPASVLLARKTNLPDAYQRRRKILKKASVDAPTNLFPAIPESWEYMDVQTLYDLNVIIDYADGNHGSLYPRSGEFGDSGVTFVTAKDLANGRVLWGSCAKLNEERARQLTKGWAEGGDILLTHNATVGRVARVEDGIDRFLLGTSVTFYRLNSKVLEPGFFFHVLNSRLWQGQLEAIMAQTTRNQVSDSKAGVLPHPSRASRRAIPDCCQG